jgi:hypothetical protein
MLLSLSLEGRDGEGFLKLKRQPDKTAPKPYLNRQNAVQN